MARSFFAVASSVLSVAALAGVLSLSTLDETTDQVPVQATAAVDSTIASADLPATETAAAATAAPAEPIRAHGPYSAASPLFVVPSTAPPVTTVPAAGARVPAHPVRTVTISGTARPDAVVAPVHRVRPKAYPAVQPAGGVASVVRTVPTTDAAKPAPTRTAGAAGKIEKPYGLGAGAVEAPKTAPAPAKKAALQRPHCAKDQVLNRRTNTCVKAASAAVGRPASGPTRTAPAQ